MKGVSDRLFDNRFLAKRLLKRAQGIETWQGVDEDEQDIVIKCMPAAALPTSARKWVEFEVAALRQRAPEHAEHAACPSYLGVEDATLYLVRRFVRGRTVRERLAAAPLPMTTTIALAIRLLKTLEQLHAAGVVHRNIKPENVVLRDDDSPVLIDFALARHMFLSESFAELSADSIRYLSPEQSGVLERGVDSRTDLYAVGLLAYEAVAGRSPLLGDGISEILRSQLTSSPAPLQALVPSVARAFDRIVARLLRKDPRDRYQTAGGARADLEELAAALDAGQADPEIVVGLRDTRGSLTEPAFTGRVAELETLEHALAGAKAGNGGVVLVEGDSGIGKTWLLEELGRSAVRHDAWILRGQGLAQVAPRPFQVLAGVSREIVASAPAGSARRTRLVERLGDTATTICESLPQMQTIFGDAPPTTAGLEVKAEDRSMAALSALLDALGSEAQPALLLLDDAQWADPPTLRLLQRWQAQAMPKRYVLVVLGSRTEEVTATHPLRSSGTLHHVRLEPFQDLNVREQVASMAGPLPEQALDLIVSQASGNPFLVSAVLHGLVESGTLTHAGEQWRLDAGALAELQVSGRIADLLAARIDRLPPATRQLLAVGALLGRTFDPAVAGELSGIEDQQAVGIVQSQRGSLLWLAGNGATCTFLHDRVREELLAHLPEPEQHDLHLRAANLLEVNAADHPFELAYHYDAAGVPERALLHAIHAAERAHAQHDMDVAERYYRIATRGLRDDASPSVRYRVARGLGDVLLVRSRYDECRQALDDASRLAPDDRARAELEERRTQLALKLGDLKVACQHGEHALRLIGRYVPGGNFVCALVVIWQFFIQVLHTRFPTWFLDRRALERADDDMYAIRIYQSLSAPYFFGRGAVWALWAHLCDLNLTERYVPSAARGRAYGLHGAICSGFPRFFERAIRYTRAGATLCADRGDLWGQARAIQFLSLSLCATGRYREALDASEESAHLFERAGDTWEANGPLCWAALARYRMGDLKGAFDAARRLYERGRALDDAHGVAFGLDTWARASEGRVPADVLQQELRRRDEHLQTSSVIAQAEAIRLLALGQYVEAEALIEKWLLRMRKERALFHESNVSLILYLVAAQRGQVEAAPPGDRARILERARRTCRRALETAQKFRNCKPGALREAARIAAMSHQFDDARERIDESIRSAADLGARFELALSREVRGQLGTVCGWPGAAADLEEARRELHVMRAPLAERAAVKLTVSLIDRFSAALEAGHRIARSMTTDAVFESLREGTLVLLRAQRCSILERSSEGSHEVRVVYGDAGPISPSTATEVLASGRGAIRVTSDFPIASDETLVGSALGMPIFVRGRAFGLVYITLADVSSAFGEEELRIAEFLTTLAGAALENVEGIEKIREFSRELEEHVEARTAALADANAELKDSLFRLKQTQDQLLHAGRMTAVGTLVAGLSHELNNPLAVIIGHVENMLRLPSSDDRLRVGLDAIDRQARRSAKLVKALLDFSRAGPPTREAIEARALVADVLDLIGVEARRRDIELHTSVGDQLPLLLVSQPEIESALVNVATNALQATPPGGKVEILAEAAERNGRPGVTFIVRDTGTGILPEILSHIFDPFFTTKPVGEGTGMGLSLSRQAVTAHDGEIGIDSTPGVGTSTMIWLPSRDLSGHTVSK